MAASDNGYGWNISDMDWASYIYTAGSPVFLPNRVRVYGANINGDYVGVKNRIYVTPYLTGVEIKEGNSGYHSFGAVCEVRITDEIKCLRFWGANDVPNSTVKDMIEELARAAGGNAIFPGDTIVADLTLVPGSETEI